MFGAGFMPALFLFWEVMFMVYSIIPYEESYRDDMIFMVLEAKDALGRIPTLNGDLLDIQKNYLDAGDMFLAGNRCALPSDRLHRL